MGGRGGEGRRGGKDERTERKGKGGRRKEDDHDHAGVKIQSPNSHELTVLSSLSYTSNIKTTGRQPCTSKTPLLYNYH